MKPWPLVMAWAILCLGVIAIIGYIEKRKDHQYAGALYDTRGSP